MKIPDELRNKAESHKIQDHSLTPQKNTESSLKTPVKIQFSGKYSFSYFITLFYSNARISLPYHASFEL